MKNALIIMPAALFLFSPFITFAQDACEGNFDCDLDVDGMDAAVFKTTFGRSSINNPCTADSPCNGAFFCDGDVDGADTTLFKSDFGRNSFNRSCPTCLSGVECCMYTTTSSTTTTC